MDQIMTDPLAATGGPASVDRWSDGAAFRAASGHVSVNSILVMKVDHIGDFILSFDALVALREAFPAARIDLLCAPWNEGLARSLGLFDSVHTVTFFSKRADGVHPKLQPGVLSHLPNHQYDVAIDLRVDPDTRVLLRYVTARYRVGFESAADNDILAVCVPHHVPRQSNGNIGIHQSLLMLRLVRSLVDFAKRPDTVKALLLGRVAEPCAIDLSAAHGRMLVICNTSSGRAVKNWPQDRFRALIRWLAIDMDAVVLLLGGSDQLAETADIMGHCASANVISAVNRTTIRQAIGLVAQASLYVGNDSGLTHVAGRVGVPTVALFSGIDPTVMWAPLGENVTVLRAPVPCSPCHILAMEECVGEHACMRNLSETSVRGAVRSRLLTARRYGEDASAPSGSVRQNASFRGWADGSSQQTPQRYLDNLPRYIAAGGRLELERLLKGFVTNNAGNRGDLNRFYTLALIFDQVMKEQLDGDIAELGVYKGNTAVMLAHLARQIGSTAYLLDTYEGFDASDLAGVDANKRMEFADTSLEQVRALVGEPNVRYVKGFFPGTADQIPHDSRFCLVHIDCDLYAPFRASLDYFYPRMVPGGFMVLHDYSSLHWDGAERAVDEFFADKPESAVPVPDGSGTVLIRKAKAPDRYRNWFVQGKVSGFANAWTTVSQAGSADCLATGWAQPEEWGVWGLGPSHVLSLYCAHPPQDAIELTAETTAVLVAGRTQLAVQVCVGGELLDTWHYRDGENRAVRKVTIPRRLVRVDDGLPILEVEFRPQSLETPHRLDPAIPDDRPLGMGLIRFRQRTLPAAGEESR